jgi:hypothetical protein
MNTIYQKHDIKNDGYVLLNGVLTPEQLNFGLSCIQNDNKVNYSIMKQFIDNTFFPAIQKNTNAITNPTYVKFRFSNNNNSTDASTFHGDIYNHTNNELLPIYTCLCYFDDAQLEVIPGSHKFNNSDWSINTYNKKVVLDVKQGDILVFHSNMHHRGVNYNKIGDRRLLQVFEVFPDQETYNSHFSKLVIVQSSKSFLMQSIINPVLYNLSKFPIIIDYATFIHYILMYNDLHYKISLMDISPWEKKNKYVSYEPGRRVNIEDVINKPEDINVNVLCNSKVKSVPYGNFYLYFYILYWIVSLIILYMIKKIWFNGYNFKKLQLFKKIKRLFNLKF